MQSGARKGAHNYHFYSIVKNAVKHQKYKSVKFGNRDKASKCS